MALTNILLLSQIASHIILIILSICIIVPFAYNRSEFCGHCLLFSNGKWLEEDGMFDVVWSSNGFCNFPFCTGFFLLFVSIAQIYRYARRRGEEQSFLSLFIDCLLGTIMFGASIISAIMITLGFIVWCDGMTERFPSCETSAGQNIFRGDTEKIDTSNFYIEMGTAQFGAWGAFAISVGIGVIALLKLIDNHQVRNIKVSMYMERQRLVHEPLQISSAGQSTPPMTTEESNAVANNQS